jgi:hypothetical protein
MAMRPNAVASSKALGSYSLSLHAVFSINLVFYRFTYPLKLLLNLQAVFWYRNPFTSNDFSGYSTNSNASKN